MKLNTLPSVAQRKSKRLGRGSGSGKGSHTVGRGTKGQGSRVGKPVPLWFEGGQLPMLKKLPFMRGKDKFSSFASRPQLITMAQLSKVTEKEVTRELLKKHGFIRYADMPVKLVGNGALKSAYVLRGIKTSAPAKASIEKAGGKAVVLSDVRK